MKLFEYDLLDIYLLLLKLGLTFCIFIGGIFYLALTIKEMLIRYKKEIFTFAHLIYFLNLVFNFNL